MSGFRSFMIDAPIVMESDEDIAQALRDIADKIEDGIDGGILPGENQCMEWKVGDDDEINDRDDYYDRDDDYYDRDDEEDNY